MLSLKDLEMGNDAVEDQDAGNGSQSRHYFLFDPSDDEEQRWMTWEQKLTVLDHNLVAHNGGHGLLSADNVPMEIRANTFRDNAAHGICLRLPGLLSSHRVIAQLANNDVLKNGGCGLQASLTSLLGGRVELAGNGFYANGSHGVQLRLSGRVVENDSVGNGEAALSLEGELQVKVSHNRLHCGHGLALRMPPPASLFVRGLISNNEFFSSVPEALLKALNCAHFEARGTEGLSPLGAVTPPPAAFSHQPLAPGLRCVANIVKQRQVAGAEAWRAMEALDPPPRPWVESGRSGGGTGHGGGCYVGRYWDHFTRLCRVAASRPRHGRLSSRCRWCVHASPCTRGSEYWHYTAKLAVNSTRRGVS